ncbi:MAG: Asp-tRNA(Asn)/Glu-tRNA(Gln) amidotransferase subunit GatC [Chlamydiota bacterium]
MAALDEKELEKLIHLCRIDCTEEEKKNLHAHLANVLKYVEQLSSVDTEGVEPCYRVNETSSTVTRKDVPGNLLSRERFLANAPSHVGGMIRVPPVIKF